MVEVFNRTLHPVPALVGSLIGTVLFGILMQMMDMMPMVAALVGSESVAVAWLVHLTIGAIFGIGFAFFAAWVPLPAWANGLTYGVAVWVFGALLVMPLWLGMPGMVFNLTTATPWWSLMGHLVYGLTTGVVYGWMGFKSIQAKTTAPTPTG